MVQTDAVAVGPSRRAMAPLSRRAVDGLGDGCGLERRISLCERMIDIASAFFSVCGKELRQTGRSRTEIARVRQIAMYVTHVTLRLTMTDVGRGFGRDRTTVMHACHLIEDMRDDEEFDRIVQRFEKIARAAFADDGVCP